MSTLSVDGLHWGTAHIRHHISPHALDFGLYPLPFKPYGRAHTLSLDRPEPGGTLPRDSMTSFLSGLLHLAYGVTSVRQTGGMTFLSRTVPSAGGLYPCHLYLGILPVNGEETGVYYYDPPGHRLTQIRTGKTRSADLRKSPSRSPLVFMITACLYNSVWKYRDRALRYVLLDGGHLAENLVMGAQDFNPAVCLDYDDTEIAGLLGLDLSWEVPLALISLGWDKSVSSLVRTLADQSTPCFPEVLIRPGEVRYMSGFPLPAKAHAAARGSQRAAAARSGVWSDAPLETLSLSCLFSGTDPHAAQTGRPELPELMIRRRSCRNFIPGQVSQSDQAFLMDWILGAVRGEGLSSITLAMACQNCEGLSDGLYAVEPETGRLACMQRGALNAALAEVCLCQTWIRSASLVFLCLANLKTLEDTGGIRAYRHAMIAAGRLGQRVYLGAEVLDWGCCGIGAIYDREAQELLGLNGESALLYALAAGPVKKKIV